MKVMRNRNAICKRNNGNNRALYESIMNKVSKVVKNALYEGVDDSDFYDDKGNWGPVWKEGAEYQIKAFDIEWDTDGVPIRRLGLPKKIELIVHMDEDGDESDLDDFVCDYLSDEFGYCIYGFQVKMWHLMIIVPTRLSSAWWMHM